MHTQFGIAHASALDRQPEGGLSAGERAASVAKFSALALAFAAGIWAIAAIGSLPPGRASLRVAPGQAAAAVGLDALGDRTDFFGVGEGGLDVSVSAPEGKSFAFADGSKGPVAQVKVGLNRRGAYGFALVGPKGEREDRVVDFRGWGAPRAMRFESGDIEPGLVAGQSWRIHSARQGKQVYDVVDAASYRYALRPGQDSAVLALPFIPLAESAPSDRGANGYAGSYLAGADFSVLAGKPFRAALAAPPGMSLRAAPGGKLEKAYEFDVAPGARYAWTVELVDAGGSSYPVRVEVEASEAPPVATPAKTAARSPK